MRLQSWTIRGSASKCEPTEPTEPIVVKDIGLDKGIYETEQQQKTRNQFFTPLRVLTAWPLYKGYKPTSLQA